MTFALAAPLMANAHEVPSDVTVQMFVRPAGDRLELLVRVPLEAMRDLDLPLRGPGYLDLANVERLEPALRYAAMVWIADGVEVFEQDRQLQTWELVSARLSLPSDRSFADYSTAAAHARGEQTPEINTDLVWQQALLDVVLEYPIESERSEFSIEPALAHLGVRTSTVLRFITPDGADRAFQYLGDPGLVRLDPRWHQAALRFVALGFNHILDGIDHLLFLLCLIIPIRRFRPLVAIVTSFTVAHSITLVASAVGLAPGALWFPPLIETLIAASIVYMAIENIVDVDGKGLRRRWMIAFAFGLVHGFGFSFALRETLQFAGSHLLTSLLAFNVGVELGQLVVLAVTVPALGLLFARMTTAKGKVVAWVLSAILAHEAWHWMTSRGSELSQYSFEWPTLDPFLLPTLMRWATLAFILAAAVWLLRELFGRAHELGPESGSSG